MYLQLGNLCIGIYTEACILDDEGYATLPFPIRIIQGKNKASIFVINNIWNKNRNYVVRVYFHFPHGFINFF